MGVVAFFLRRSATEHGDHSFFVKAGRGGSFAPVRFEHGRQAPNLTDCGRGCRVGVAMASPKVHVVAYAVDLGFGAARGAKCFSLMFRFWGREPFALGLIWDRIGRHQNR